MHISSESWWILFGSTYVPLPQTHAGTLPPVNITGTSITNFKVNIITVKVSIRAIPDGMVRVIIGYHRLDLGQAVVGQYVNRARERSTTFSSLLPGAKYRITIWGLGGGSDHIRSRSPAVVEVATNQQSELTRTTVTVQ
jgi:hypothetical protein